MAEHVQQHLRPPPIPPEADLKDFAYTAIYRARLFGSSFHARANDAEWRAGVTLWLKSQDQVPAGSLPDDDIDLCRLAELGRDVKAWCRVKAMALHGWVKHADGRLYHPVVTEISLRALQVKEAAKAKTEAARAARLAKRLSQSENASVTDENSLCDRADNPLSQNERAATKPLSQAPIEESRVEESRREDSPPKPPSRKRGGHVKLEGFEAWWARYPHKVGKGAAERAWPKALALAHADELTAGVERYIASKPPDREWCHPATWLNAKRWLDQPAAANGQAQPQPDTSIRGPTGPPPRPEELWPEDYPGERLH